MNKEIQNKLLLAIDIDGTLIPNSSEAPNIEGIKKFGQLVKNLNAVLIYPTGRHFAMTIEAIKNTPLPMPDFLIVDNGASVYFRDGEKWKLDEEYRKKLIDANPDFDSAKIIKFLSKLPFLQLEEEEKQDKLKAGFYVDLEEKPKEAISIAKAILAKNKIKNIKIIYSQDLKNKVGILEVLPDDISKLAGINYLSLRGASIPLFAKGGIAARQSPNIRNSPLPVLFAGDEGNDLDVFASGIPSIMVGNARKEIKNAVREMNLDSVYFAEGKDVSGVLEGIENVKL